jgi:hypothetical protein
VTVRFLLACVVFAASAAFAGDVPPSTQSDWYNLGPWSVAGIAFADGHESCVVANTQPLPDGLSAFVLSDFGGGDSSLMFRDTTITWDASGESATFQIDGNPSFTAQAQTDTKRNVLYFPLFGTPRTVMGAFMNQLASGRILRVTPTAGTPRTFALDGAKPALDAFGRCIAAMSSTGKRPS